MLVQFAKRLQEATQHRAKWFGRLWPLLLGVSLTGLAIVTGVKYGMLDQTLVGSFFATSNLNWQSLLVTGTASGVLALLSLFFDEKLTS